MFSIREHTDTKSVGNNCFPQNNLVIVPRISFTSDAKFRGASLLAQLVKNLSAMKKTWVQFLGGEDPLEKEMVTHSSILAWRIPWTEESGRLQSMGSQESDMTWRLNHQTTTTKVQYWFRGLFPNMLYEEAEFTIKYDYSPLRRRPGFDPWIRKIFWRREWQSIPVFLPGEFMQPGGLQSMGSQRVRHDWPTNTTTNILQSPHTRNRFVTDENKSFFDYLC